MPPPAVRFALEAAFLVLVALGAGLVGFPPAAIAVVLLVAAAVVALVERERARKLAADESSPERVREPRPHVEPAVSRRVARDIVARTAPPPPPPREPEPDTVPTVPGPPRDWNLWEIERAVRRAPSDSRQEEWSAILIHLREFANAGGDLPIEFDGLVRESFTGVLEAEPEPAAAS